MNAITETAPLPPRHAPITSRVARRRSAGVGLIGLGVAALLGSAVRLRSVRRSRESTLAVGGAALAVGWVAANRLLASRAKPAAASELRLEKSVTIKRAPSEVYAFWADLRNLPKFMKHLESVEVEGELSTWRAKGPAGLKLEWQAEATEDRINELIAWRSLPGSSLGNRGAVRFAKAPGGRGTELTVQLSYAPPGGALGAAFARLLGPMPALSLETDLRRLKQILETGEIMHSDASIHSGLHAAQPMQGQFSGKAGL